MSGGDRAEFLDVWQQHVTRPGSEKLLDWLDSLRDRVRREVPEERDRKRVFQALFARCMASGAPCGEEELRALLADAGKEREHG